MISWIERSGMAGDGGDLRQRGAGAGEPGHRGVAEILVALQGGRAVGARHLQRRAGRQRQLVRARERQRAHLVEHDGFRPGAEGERAVGVRERDGRPAGGRGDASYSIYLLHALVLPMFKMTDVPSAPSWSWAGQVTL